MEAKDDGGWTALYLASTFNHPDICLLLISTGIDLMAVNNGNKTALYVYGNDLNDNPPTDPRPALSNAVKKKHREILRAAFANGPHPSQVQRRKDERWDRRWPFMSVMVGCGFHPLADTLADQLAAQLSVDTSAAIPDEPIETEEQRRALLQLKVFGHEGIMRTIGSYL